MYVSVNPNVITLHAANGVFSPQLPVRLAGFIGPQEFAASIARCNAAYSTGALWLARLFMFAGMIAGLVCFGISWSSMDTFNGPNLPLLFGGFACMFLAGVVGGFWVRAIQSQRVTALQAAIAREHEYYNSVERAQAMGGARGPPISWTMSTQTTISWGYRRLNTRVNCMINIELPNAMLVAGVPQPLMAGAPPVQFQPQYQQQYAGYQQPQAYGQLPQPGYQPMPAYAQPISAPPAYDPAAAAYQPPQKADVSQPEGQQAPLLGPNYNSTS